VSAFKSVLTLFIGLFINITIVDTSTRKEIISAILDFECSLETPHSIISIHRQYYDLVKYDEDGEQLFDEFSNRLILISHDPSQYRLLLEKHILKNKELSPEKTITLYRLNNQMTIITPLIQKLGFSRNIAVWALIQWESNPDNDSLYHYLKACSNQNSLLLKRRFSKTNIPLTLVKAAKSREAFTRKLTRVLRNSNQCPKKTIIQFRKDMELRVDNNVLLVHPETEHLLSYNQ
jgi:hypothetical protein